jgi:protein TonB
MDGSVSDDPVRGRLLVALLASAALHLSLMYGVAVRTPPQPAAEPILARIDRAPSPLHDPPRRAGPPPSTVPPGPMQRRVHDAVATPAPPQPASSGAGALLEPAPPHAAEADPPAWRTANTASAEDALPPVEMPLLADPTWYSAAQLDVFPVAREPVRPSYPQGEAAASGGVVTLLLRIDEAGRVHECSVVEARPQAVFDEAALAAFRAAQFLPGRKDGRAVRSRVLVKVAFAPAPAPAALR